MFAVFLVDVHDLLIIYYRHIWFTIIYLSFADLLNSSPLLSIKYIIWADIIN